MKIGHKSILQSIVPGLIFNKWIISVHCYVCLFRTSKISVLRLFIRKSWVWIKSVLDVRKDYKIICEIALHFYVDIICAYDAVKFCELQHLLLKLQNAIYMHPHISWLTLAMTFVQYWSCIRELNACCFWVMKKIGAKNMELPGAHSFPLQRIPSFSIPNTRINGSNLPFCC